MMVVMIERLKKTQGSGLFITVLLPLLILFSGLSITFQLWSLLRTDASHNLQMEFNDHASAIETQITARLKVYSQLLYSTRGLFFASKSVRRNEFKTFVTTLEIQKLYPGIQGVGFALLIPAAEKQKHLAAIRSEGFPNYTIKPEGERELLYTSIIYIEPFEKRNLRVMGYDMYSEETRRSAMNKAWESNETVMSGRVKLVQETSQDVQMGFLLYLPVYHHNMDTSSLEKRHSNLLGWVYSPFRAKDFVHGIFNKLDDLNFEIYDGETSASNSALFLGVSKALKRPLFNTVKKIEFGQHQWTVNIHSQPKFEAKLDLDRANFIAALGIMSSILLSFITFLLGSGRDRAWRLATEMNAAFRKTEERFKTLFTHAPVGIAIIDSLTGQIYNINQKYADIVGLTLAELQATTLIKMTHPDDLHTKQENIALMNAGKIDNFIMQKRYIHKNGEIVWVQLTVARLHFTERGNPCHHCIAEDITVRKQLEKTLAESQTLLRTIIDTVPVRIFWKDNNLCYLGSNNAFASDAGMSHPDELIGKDDYQMAWANDADYYRADDRAVLESGLAKLSYDERLTSPIGETIWIRTSKAPFINQNNEVIGVVGVYEDITVRKRIEDEVRTLSIVIEQSPVSIVITDFRANITYVNPKFIESSGYSFGEAVGKNPRLLQSGLTTKETYQQLWNSLTQGNPWHGELINQRKNGALYWEEAHISPVRDLSGVITHYVAAKTDITLRIKAEELIQQLAFYDPPNGLT